MVGADSTVQAPVLHIRENVQIVTDTRKEIIQLQHFSVEFSTTSQDDFVEHNSRA